MGRSLREEFTRRAARHQAQHALYEFAAVQRAFHLLLPQLQELAGHVLVQGVGHNGFAVAPKYATPRIPAGLAKYLA